MSEWVETNLGKIADWFSGGTPSKSNDAYWDGDIPWISAKTMTEHKVSQSNLTISKIGLENGSRLASKGDILLLVRGSGLFNDIPICWVEEPVAFNQDIKAIRSHDPNLQEYLYYWLKGNKQNLYGILEETGIGAGKFDTKLLKNMTIRFPSVAVERKKIIDLVSSLYNKIDLLHQQNKTLEALGETLFRQWFVEEPEEFVSLEEFIELNPKLSLKKGQAFPYLEMKSVQTNSASPSNWYDRKYTSGFRSLSTGHHPGSLQSSSAWAQAS